MRYQRTATSNAQDDDLLIELPTLEQNLNPSRPCHGRDYPTRGNFAPELLLFGLPSGTSLGTMPKFLEWVHPEDRDAIASHIRQTLDEGTKYKVRFRIKWLDGRSDGCFAQGQIFRNEQGQPVRMLGVAVDATDRIIAEQAREQELDRTKDELQDL